MWGPSTLLSLPNGAEETRHRSSGRSREDSATGFPAPPLEVGAYSKCKVGAQEGRGQVGWGGRGTLLLDAQVSSLSSLGFDVGQTPRGLLPPYSSGFTSLWLLSLPPFLDGRWGLCLGDVRGPPGLPQRVCRQSLTRSFPGSLCLRTVLGPGMCFVPSRGWARGARELRATVSLRVPSGTEPRLPTVVTHSLTHPSSACPSSLPRLLSPHAP